MAVSDCQCDDAIPGSFARVVGNVGTILSNRQTALIVRIFANRHTSTNTI
jgi:hypothetical protein